VSEFSIALSMMKKMHSDHNGAPATGQRRRETNTRGL
jgi:hypothetical protein